MRYWFAALGLLIVVRTFVWLLKEHRDRHRRLRHLPDAGTVGRLLVLEGGGVLEEGAELTLPYEGVLGSDRTCDICVPDPELSGEHLDFSFQPQLGMLVYPRRGVTCLVDGEEVTHRSRARETPLRHGSVLELGSIRLRVRLFEGLQTGGGATLLPDEPELPTIPNEGYMNTAELPVVNAAPEDGSRTPEPPPQVAAEQPRVGDVPRRAAPYHRVRPGEQPGSPQPVNGQQPRPLQPQGTPAQDAAPQVRPVHAQEEESDPFARSDRQRIVRLYEDTEEAGARPVRRRSSWRHDDDA